MRTLLFAGALALVCPAPAYAALVNDYSATDDVWNTPVATNHSLLDARNSFSPGSPFSPTASYAFGVAPDTELGFWSAWGASSAGLSFGALEPYVKYKLPLVAGPVGFGLVAGALVPTGFATDFTAGLEGVTIVTMSPNTTLDVGVGLGRGFNTNSALGHGNLALYHTLSGGQVLAGELYTNLSSVAVPAFGEHLVLQWPLLGYLAGDVGVAFNETTQGFAGVAPQLGLTWTL